MEKVFFLFLQIANSSYLPDKTQEFYKMQGIDDAFLGIFNLDITADLRNINCIVYFPCKVSINEIHFIVLYRMYTTMLDILKIRLAEGKRV